MHKNESFLKCFQEPKNPTRCTSTDMTKSNKRNKVKKMMDVDKKKMDEEKEECVRCGSKFRDKNDLEVHIREEHEFRCIFKGCEMRTGCRNELR